MSTEKGLFLDTAGAERGCGSGIREERWRATWKVVVVWCGVSARPRKIRPSFLSTQKVSFSTEQERKEVAKAAGGRRGRALSGKRPRSTASVTHAPQNAFERHAFGPACRRTKRVAASLLVSLLLPTQNPTQEQRPHVDFPHPPRRARPPARQPARDMSRGLHLFGPPEAQSLYLLQLQNKKRGRETVSALTPPSTSSSSSPSPSPSAASPAASCAMQDLVGETGGFQHNQLTFALETAGLGAAGLTDTRGKRRSSGQPRKCNNPSCDRIVTKRNFCYKCQKRKERGIALNPKLPSLKQVLLPSQPQPSQSQSQSQQLSHPNTAPSQSQHVLKAESGGMSLPPASRMALGGRVICDADGSSHVGSAPRLSTLVTVSDDDDDGDHDGNRNGDDKHTFSRSSPPSSFSSSPSPSSSSSPPSSGVGLNAGNQQQFQASCFYPNSNPTSFSLSHSPPRVSLPAPHFEHQHSNCNGNNHDASPLASLAFVSAQQHHQHGQEDEPMETPKLPSIRTLISEGHTPHGSFDRSRGVDHERVDRSSPLHPNGGGPLRRSGQSVLDIPFPHSGDALSCHLQQQQQQQQQGNAGQDRKSSSFSLPIPAFRSVHGRTGPQDQTELFSRADLEGFHAMLVHMAGGKEKAASLLAQYLRSDLPQSLLHTAPTVSSSLPSHQQQLSFHPQQFQSDSRFSSPFAHQSFSNHSPSSSFPHL